MTARQVIDEIVSLSPEEQAKVIHFAARLEARHRLTGEQLGVLARQMVDAPSPLEADVLRDEIVRGFYGRATDG
jgi:hypothetical protein